MNSSTKIFSFQEKQFCRFFPFYILVGKDLKIASVGKTLEKIFPQTVGAEFSECFTITRPGIQAPDYESLFSLNEKLVIITCCNTQKTILRGQIEWIPETGELLFIGSPWFGSIEELIQNDLTLNDFAFHDPMIDLLHILKTQEITNNDLKQLLPALQKQKETLKEDKIELERLSLVARANENGIIFIDQQGRINWCNEGFEKLTGYSKEEITGKTPIEVLKGPLSNRDVLKKLTDDFASGSNCVAEVIHYRKDGSWFWGRSKGQLIINPDKSVNYFAMIEDITAEKAAQNKLKEYEERLRMALNNVGDNFWEHNFVTGKTTFSNPTNNLLGFPIDSFEDASLFWWSRVYPEDMDILKNNDELYRSGSIDHHSSEYRILHKDGNILWVLDRGMVIEKDADGMPLKIIGTHINITNQKELEIELSQRVNQFRSFSENIPGVIFEYEFRKDGTEGLRYLSPTIESVFGVKPDDFQSFTRYIHPDDIGEIVRKNKICKETLAPFYDESRLIIPGKETIWHAVTSSFSYVTPEGSLVFTGFMQDITLRKNSEQALKIKEEKYRSIIANMRLGLLEVQNNEIIQYANQEFCNMSGYKIDELMGRKASSLFVNGNHGVIEEKNELRARGISDAYELAVKNKQGDVKWWLISGAPRYDDKGVLVGSIGIHLDITEQKHLELELIKARETAESSAIAKQNFLANMSHEIRTPMNAIIGMANQLAKSDLHPEQKFFLNTIESASNNLLVIINDILDLSKIEAGKLNLETIGFSLKEVIEKGRHVMLYKSEEKDISLNMSQYDPALATVLLGDPYRLNQVLLNLISNAIKFTDNGNVDINCALLEDTGDKQIVEIKVSDTGIGMEEDFVKNLFQKFTQEDDSVTRRFGGTGLGMSICKELVELMCGSIEAKSSKGKGTTITVKIPFMKGEEKDLPYEETNSVSMEIFKFKKILVADDNEMNRLVASTILKNYGVVVEEAENGLEAIQKVSNGQFDLILMDVQMPLMDGLAATIEIRKSVSKHIPIIALTALAYKEDEERLLHSGMNGYLSKPFEERNLIKTIGYWLQQKNAHYETVPDNPQPLYNIANLKEISTDQEFILKVLEIFVEQTPVTVKEMIHAYEKGEFKLMSQLAHKLKSSLGSLLVAGITREVEEIEFSGIEPGHKERLDPLLQKIKQVVNDTVLQIKNDYLIII